MPSRYSSSRSNKGRKVVAAQLPGPCTRCGGIVTAEMNWQADHIMQRSLALAAGWTEQQIDAATNLGPAHASCNAKANKRVRQTKAEQVEQRIPRVNRPSFGKNKNENVFSDDHQSPASCPTKSLSDAAEEAQDGF